MLKSMNLGYLNIIERVHVLRLLIDRIPNPNATA